MLIRSLCCILALSAACHAQEAAGKIKEAVQLPPSEEQQGRMILQSDGEARLDLEDVSGSALFCNIQGERQLQKLFYGMRQKLGGWEAEAGLEREWRPEEQLLEPSLYRLRLTRPGLSVNATAGVGNTTSWTSAANLEGPVDTKLHAGMSGLGDEVQGWDWELKKKLWGSQWLSLGRECQDLGAGWETVDRLGLVRARTQYRLEASWKQRYRPDVHWQEAGVEMKVFW